MSEKRLLTVACPRCKTVLQVKTHATEKTFACPKCAAQVTASVAAPRQAAEILPVAALWVEPAQPMPVAQFATAAGRSPRPMPLLVGVSAAVLVLLCVVTYLLVRVSGGGASATDASAQNTSAMDTNQSMAAVQAGQSTSQNDDGPPPVIAQPFVPTAPVAEDSVAPPPPVTKPQQDGGTLESPAKQAAKEQMQLAQQDYMQAERQWTQRRNWRLANAGRMAAMGLKLVPENQEREKQQRDQAKQAYDRARQIYLQTP